MVLNSFFFFISPPIFQFSDHRMCGVLILLFLSCAYVLYELAMCVCMWFWFSFTFSPAAYSLYSDDRFSREAWLEFWDTLSHVLEREARVHRASKSLITGGPARDSNASDTLPAVRAAVSAANASAQRETTSTSLDPTADSHIMYGVGSLMHHLDQVVNTLRSIQRGRVLSGTGARYLKDLLASGDVVLEAATFEYAFFCSCCTWHSTHHTLHSTHHISHITPDITHHTSHQTSHPHITHHTSHQTSHTTHHTRHHMPRTTPHITPHTTHHAPHITNHTSHQTSHITSHTTPRITPDITHHPSQTTHHTL